MASLTAVPGPKTVVTVGHSATLPLLLYAMTGFTGLLAEQGLEKYITLLVGATVTASAVVVFTYFLGFALGGLLAARWLKHERIRRPLRAYALVELAVGISCIAFAYGFHPAVALLAPLQTMVSGETGKLLVRFACGCLLVLPVATLMGSSFPLIAQALDNGNSQGPRKWLLAYSSNLTGAALASLAAPFLIIPAIGLRGAMWICFGICSVVAALVRTRNEPAPAPRALFGQRSIPALDLDHADEG